MEAFCRTTTNAIHAAVAIAVPAALGCALFPELGVWVFGRDEFAPAEENLRMLAPWLLLVYVSMPVGSCLTAAGRQKAWTIVLFAGVATTTALEPALIRWAQQLTGNAGLGVCAAGLVGEIVTVTSAILLLPRGILRGLEPVRLVPPLVSGMAMAAVAFATGRLAPIAGAVLAVASYLLAMHLTGGLDMRQLFSFARGLRHPA
jgi:O-antigen/teichoic acid export membrane protein